MVKCAILLVICFALSALGDWMLGVGDNGFFNNMADWGKVAIAASGVVLWEAVLPRK